MTTNFELFNLVPFDHPYQSKSVDTPQKQEQQPKTRSSQRTRPHHSIDPHKTSTANETSILRWRRVGLISASSARLDTIVWPGGDIVVSGMSMTMKIMNYHDLPYES